MSLRRHILVSHADVTVTHTEYELIDSQSTITFLPSLDKATPVRFAGPTGVEAEATIAEIRAALALAKAVAAGVVAGVTAPDTHPKQDA